jgi:N-acetylneuraminic acid mutarotase
MAEAQSAPVAAAINGIIYVAGGFNGHETASLRAYNPQTNAWTSRADMPAGRYQSDGAGVINGQLYVVGGWDNSYSWLPHSDLFVYDPASNTWSSRTSMPILSGSGTCGVINGKLYVVTPSDGYSGFYNFLHVYDPATNSWSSLASSPRPLENATAGVIDGKLYVAGGYDGSTWSNTLDIYDPATNSWTTGAPMPTAGFGSAGSSVIDGKLYVVGGSNDGGSVATTLIYDPSTDTWTTDTPMPTARSGLVAAVVQGVLYAIGGANGATLFATNEAFTPATASAVTPTVTATDAGGVYNGNPYAASATAIGAGGASIAGSFTFTYVDSQGNALSSAPVNAGAYSVTAHFTSGDPQYTNADSAPITMVITPAAPTVTAIDAGGTYNGQSFPASATASGIDGAAVNGTFTYTYYLGNSVGGAGTSAAPTDVGTYTVVAAFASSDPNYANAVSDPVTFTIAGPELPPTVSPGQTLTILGTSFDPSAQTDVVFTDQAGRAVRVPALAVSATTVQVLVPPILDGTTWTLGAGTVTIAVEQQSTGQATITTPAGQTAVSALPPVTSGTGAITLAALNQMQSMLAAAMHNWGALQHTSQGAVKAKAMHAMLAGLKQQIAGLQAHVQRIVNGRLTRISLGHIHGHAVFLDTGSIRMLDQMFAAYWPGSIWTTGASTAPATLPSAKLLAASRPQQVAPADANGAAGLLQHLLESFETMGSVGKIGVGLAALGAALIGGAPAASALAAAEFGGFLLTWATALAPAIVGLAALNASAPFTQDISPPPTADQLKAFYVQIAKGLLEFVPDFTFEELGAYLASKGVADKTLLQYFHAWWDAAHAGAGLLARQDSAAPVGQALASAQDIFAHRPLPAILVTPASPPGFTFTVVAGGANPHGTLTIANTGPTDSILTYAVTPDSQGRIRLGGAIDNSLGGGLEGGASARVGVSVDVSGLSPGTWAGAVFVTSNVTGADHLILVPITVTIEAPPANAEVDPAQLSFSARQNDPLPASQTFTVTNTGPSLSVLHYAVSGGASWLNVIGSAGPLQAGQSAAFTVAVTTTALSPGTYHAKISVTDQDAGTSQAVTVTYTVSAQSVVPGPLVFKGNFAGSGTGTINTIYGSGKYTNNLSGMVTFSVSGDGSLLNPYAGTLAGQGQDVAVKVSGVGPPRASSGVEFATVPISSNLHQVTAEGSGNGFTFTFNGFISATEEFLTGTLAITLTDWTTDAGTALVIQMGVTAKRQ